MYLRMSIYWIDMYEVVVDAKCDFFFFLEYITMEADTCMHFCESS